MGGCVSTTSSKSSCSRGSYGDNKVSSSSSSSCTSFFSMRLCGHKRSKRTFSDHVATLQHLESLQNRIFMNGRSTTSCIFTQQGRKGINQDAMIVWEDFMADDVTFCGVFDGHGPFGHLVARKVRDALPLKLLSFLSSCQANDIDVGSSVTCCNGDHSKSEGMDVGKDGAVEDDAFSLWRNVFLKSYKAMDKELISHPNLDCFCSGSTAVTIVKQGSNLYMGNIGDSRAIMGSKDANDSLVATQLTVDLKPDLPSEAERIKRCKGRVFALQDEPEVSRVWLPFDDAPGLAMARAFGDFCLKEYGVISVPEFSHRVLTERDQFIVLASDGVWDVLSNDEVVEIVSSAPSRASAARVLVESAAREWNLKYPTSKMDDCAVVCLFLDGKMDSDSSDYNNQPFSSATNQTNHSGQVMKPDGGQNSEPCLHRNNTIRSSEENKPLRRLQPLGNTETVVTDDKNWSGLEGVTRVNSLIQLPRFSDGRPDS